MKHPYRTPALPCPACDKPRRAEHQHCNILQCIELGTVTADSFVFSDVITQIEMPQITRGRCALPGAAYRSTTSTS